MANVGNHPVSRPGQKLLERQVTGVLDESVNPARLPPGGISILQNYVYRTSGGVAKRTGSGVDIGTGATGSGLAIKSGVRWYRGSPSVVRQQVVHSGDALYLRNDTTGAYTLMGNLAAGSSPAFFASVYDPAESGVTGTPASDVLIITYGSGPPMKWDGTNLTQLSSQITNHFVGCTTWHNHVWFWGDPNNPDVVFGTDINAPESYTFSTNFGGYQVGPGDGDATVQRVIGVGIYLYVFKANSIWAMQGYDYYAGNYQFSLQTIAEGTGTSAPFSVARLKDTVIFWTGAEFKALNPDTSVSTRSVPIEGEVGTAASGSQSIMRAVAGSFMVAGPSSTTIPYEDVYLCAVDDGSGLARKVLMYDDVKSSISGVPAWTVLYGWTVGAFIPWQGPADPRRLYFGNGASDMIVQVGQNATNDSGAVYQTVVQLNRDDCESADQDKWLDYVYLRLDSNAATFSGVVAAGAPSASRSFAVNVVSPGSMLWGQNWGLNWGSPGQTSYQSGVGKIDAWLRGKNFALRLTEASLTSQYEILSLAYHVIEEAYARS